MSLPLARDFNDVVAMDLKMWDKDKDIYLLHFVDMATQFSISKVIYSKDKTTIIDKIMTHWIGTGLGACLNF